MRSSIFFLFAAWVLPILPGFGEGTWTVTVSGDELARCERDRFVEFDPTEKVARLAPTYLISDGTMRSSKIREDLDGCEQVRKTFELYSPAREVEVLFYAGWVEYDTRAEHQGYASPADFDINGHPLRHVRDKNKMHTGGWDRFTIPGEYLKKGKNEIVVSGTGSLWVDADATGGKSSKKLRPEDKWRDDQLGPEDSLSGEYVFRFRVRGRPAKGTLTSPVLDLARTDRDGHGPTVAPLVQIENLKLTPDKETPVDTAIEFELRTGTTPDFRPDTWSAWFPPFAAAQAPKHRFAQWRARLYTKDSSLTPTLKSVSIEVNGTKGDSGAGALKVLEAPDNKVAVSSYPFAYADPNHPRMRHLREKYRLEDIVKNGKTDAEKFMLLSQWIREQWEGWDMGKYDYCPQWDALEILELAPAKLGLGMCTHYSSAFVQCAAALGYNARSVIVDHHCLAEAWSDRYGKWMFVDTGIFPKHPLAFKYEIDGIPVNALELHQRFLAGDAMNVNVLPEPPIPLEEWWKRYLNLYCRFAIPLRNDHLYNPEPQELEHGHTQYHWDGYLWWTDNLDPKYPEYSLQTNRPEDFYWTLNKTLIDLQASNQEGVLKVYLHGPIPNLDKFLIRKNGGEWMELEPSFDWELGEGENRLEARAVNTMGIELPANRVAIGRGMGSRG